MEGAPQTQRTTVRPEHRPGGKGVGGESTHTPTLTSWRPSTCLRTSMPPPSHPLLPSLPPSLLIHPSVHLSFHSHVHPPIARFTRTDSGHVAPAAPGPARQASACLSISASVYSPHDYFPVHLPLVPLCIHRSIHQSTHYPSVLPSTHPPTQPPVHHPFINPSIYPSIIRPSTRPSSIHLSIIYQSPICPSPKLSPSTSWVPGWGMTPRQVSSLGAGRTKESAPRFSHGPVEEKSHTSRAPRLGPPRPSHPSLLPEATGQDGAPERSGHRPVWPPHPRPAPRRSPGR